MRAPSVVAVIDDDSAVRTAIAALVASKGYQVEVYASAEEFIAHVARSEAACLVVDVHLGDLTGIDTSDLIVHAQQTCRCFCKCFQCFVFC